MPSQTEIHPALKMYLLQIDDIPITNYVPWSKPHPAPALTVPPGRRWIREKIQAKCMSSNLAGETEPYASYAKIIAAVSAVENGS
jgi:hypothetical protein